MTTKLSTKHHENSKIGHVLRISTVPFFVRSQLKKQINDLLASGYNVVIVCSPGLRLEEFNHFGRLKIIDIEISRKISLLADTRALFRLLILLFNHPICIIHSTTPKAGLLASVAGFISRTPYRFHTYTGQPWVGQSGVSAFLAKLSDRMISSLNTYVYADSKSQQDFLVENNIVDPKKIGVLGSGSLAGVDISRFNASNFSDEEKGKIRGALNIPQDAFIVLFLGRITPEKGIREILVAFNKLLELHKSAHLVFVGPVEDDFRNEFERKASMIPNVRMTGFVTDPEKYIAISQVLCLPSYREGFGTSVIEASAMGVPTIGSDIYGLKDAIVHEETGLLVRPRDSDDLFRALKFLIENPQKRHYFSVAGVKYARNFFDSGIVSGHVMEEYEKRCNGMAFK